MSSRNFPNSNLSFLVLTLFDVSQIFRHASCTSEAQTQLLHFLEGILLGFCLLGITLCSMSWMVSGFYFVPQCTMAPFIVLSSGYK